MFCTYIMKYALYKLTEAWWKIEENDENQHDFVKVNLKTIDRKDFKKSAQKDNLREKYLKESTTSGYARNKKNIQKNNFVFYSQDHENLLEMQRKQILRDSQTSHIAKNKKLRVPVSFVGDFGFKNRNHKNNHNHTFLLSFLNLHNYKSLSNPELNKIEQYPTTKYVFPKEYLNSKPSTLLRPKSFIDSMHEQEKEVEICEITPEYVIKIWIFLLQSSILKSIYKISRTECFYLNYLENHVLQYYG